MKNQKPQRSLLLRIAALAGWLLLATLALFVILVAIVVWGWSRPSVAPAAISDSSALRQMINIDIPISAVKWEIFRYPDDQGFMPAPDVYTVLIAEIELSDPTWYKPHPALEERTGAMPGSSREWLSPPFKELMRKAATDDNALAAFKCGAFTTSIRSSGRVVDGFICPSAGRVLFYLTVDAPPG